MKIAVYARYSSDLQSDASIEDQVRLCRARASREGWRIVETYTDRATSGANLLRKGVQDMLDSAQKGRFDYVIAESLDRLSRDQEDIAHIYKRLKFAEIGMLTLSEGEISELHIGLKGTMGALYLKDLADKTHRGQSGRVMAGKSGGGNSYGYTVVKAFNADGSPVRGDREINESEARVVQRIFRDYVAGISPKAIAVALNTDGVPGPTKGKGWGPSTINGNRKRGTGILNNELYVGRLVWNPQRFMKDPDTGKRVARPNPKEEWLTTDVPNLRIIDDTVWNKVKARQAELEHKIAFRDRRRPPQLFSWLPKCGECGGGFSKISSKHYGCSNARNKGTCENRLTIHQDRLEDSVLRALSSQLMAPQLCAAFCDAYAKRINELRMERNAQRDGWRRELEQLAVKREKLMETLYSGVHASLLKDDLEFIHQRRDEITSLLEAGEDAPVLLHPNMAQRYHGEVRSLIEALNEDTRRQEASDLLRRLIDKIVLTPDMGSEKLTIDLYGDLAGILALAHGQTHYDGDVLKHGGKPEAAGTPNRSRSQRDASNDEQQFKMVAGAGFEPATFRL